MNEIDEYDDSELWETVLGRDEKYTKRALLTPEQEESLNKLTNKIIKKIGPVPLKEVRQDRRNSILKS